MKGAGPLDLRAPGCDEPCGPCCCYVWSDLMLIMRFGLIRYLGVSPECFCLLHIIWNITLWFAWWFACADYLSRSDWPTLGRKLVPPPPLKPTPLCFPQPPEAITFTVSTEYYWAYCQSRSDYNSFVWIKSSASIVSWIGNALRKHGNAIRLDQPCTINYWHFGWVLPDR